MAGRLVIGANGQVVCPWCGKVTRYWLEECEDGLQVMAEIACEHLDDAEWEVIRGCKVEVVAFNPDADD
jgi:hypothetical protein